MSYVRHRVKYRIKSAPGEHEIGAAYCSPPWHSGGHLILNQLIIGLKSNALSELVGCEMKLVFFKIHSVLFNIFQMLFDSSHCVALHIDQMVYSCVHWHWYWRDIWCQHHLTLTLTLTRKSFCVTESFERFKMDCLKVLNFGHPTY